MTSKQAPPLQASLTLKERGLSIIIDDGVPYKVLAIEDINGWIISICRQASYTGAKEGVGKEEEVITFIQTVEFGWQRFLSTTPASRSDKEVVRGLKEAIEMFQLGKAREQLSKWKEEHPTGVS
jgi:hypothetical protein